MRADHLYIAPLTGLRRAAVAYPGVRLGAGGLRPEDFVFDEKFRSSISANFHLSSPADGIWTCSEANSTVELGLGRGGATRGHAFVWHSGLPAWVSGGTFTAAQLQTILWDQIDTKGAYYRGVLPCWDVVNEAVADSGGSLRGTLWYNDPGIGFQSHFNGSPNGSSVRTNFQRFNNLGLDLHVTELDFRLPVNANGFASATDLTLQGDQYFDYFGAALGFSRLKVLQTWGVYDGASWIPNHAPIGTNGIRQTMKATIPLPSHQSRPFVRLKVTR